MASYLFIFGRTQELSLHELSSLTSHRLTRITPDVVRVEVPEDTLDAHDLIGRLGGTVKIAHEKGMVDTLSAEALAPFLVGEERALTFGVSLYGDERLDTQLLRRMKEDLERLGVRARYVAPHEGNTLSSVVVAKQRVRELVVVAVADGFIVGETVAVQDFEDWNARDYGRPFADPRAGMLPPKVARMAVNLAGGGTLLDPFCGMGTILGEAMLTGWNVIGSDQSEEVVEKARKNIEWLTRLFLSSRPPSRDPVVEENGFRVKPGMTKLFVSDATHVSEHIAAESVDAIVTEPFLGSSDAKTENIKNVIKGLEKLYIGCLKDWCKILKPYGKVVIALPEYAVNERLFFVKSVIDRCENLGYTVTLGPLTYSRPQAVVRRKFFVLQKK